MIKLTLKANDAECDFISYNDIIPFASYGDKQVSISIIRPDEQKIEWHRIDRFAEKAAEAILPLFQPYKDNSYDILKAMNLTILIALCRYDGLNDHTVFPVFREKAETAYAYHNGFNLSIKFDPNFGQGYSLSIEGDPELEESYITEDMLDNGPISANDLASYNRWAEFIAAISLQYAYSYPKIYIQEEYFDINQWVISMDNLFSNLDSDEIPY